MTTRKIETRGWRKRWGLRLGSSGPESAASQGPAPVRQLDCSAQVVINGIPSELFLEFLEAGIAVDAHGFYACHIREIF
jgi:hypothetical protein